jgi:N-acetylglutamate synthase
MMDDIIQRLECAVLWAWPPRELRFLDGWLLRAAAGHTRRINSVRTLAWTGSDPERATAAAETWYAERGLPTCFQLTDATAPSHLDRLLAARGYALLPSVSILLIDAAGVLRDPGVELLHRATPSVLNVMADPHWDDATRAQRAALFGRLRRPHRFGLASVNGVPAAAGLVVVDGPFAGIFSMRTQVPFRAQGLGRRVFRSLVAWAAACGADTVYLQVEDDNLPARALYGRFAPRRAYGYWYREA